MESENKKTSKILNLFLGSYEGNIFNISLDLTTKKLTNYSFKVSENSIKVIYFYDNHIFVSGVDEIIHIYDMTKREEKGLVFTYAGSMNCIRIFKKYLFASGDDSQIYIYRMKDFTLIHTLKQHKASICHFEIHKSGKFAISSSRDSSLVIWNLTKGKKIIKYNFKNNLICNKIILYNKQKLALLFFDFEFWVFDLFKNSENYEEWVSKKIPTNSLGNKILDAFCIKEKVFLILVNGDIQIHQNILEEGEETLHRLIQLEKPAKQNENDIEIRIKNLNVTKHKKFKLLNIIYSNNEIYIYDLNKLMKSLSNLGEGFTLKKFRSINLTTNNRLTSLDSNLTN
jgi:WD40 repeat protein